METRHFTLGSLRDEKGHIFPSQPLLLGTGASAEGKKKASISWLRGLPALIPLHKAMDLLLLIWAPEFGRGGGADTLLGGPHPMNSDVTTTTRCGDSSSQTSIYTC